MTLAVLEKKMSNLSAQQQQNVESYIDFLLFQNSSRKQGARKPLDFSKYNTVTHVCSSNIIWIVGHFIWIKVGIVN